MELAEQLARDFEKIVSQYGYHIGLTGSVLYGDNPGDIDFIIYTHHADVCWPKIDMEDMLNLLGVHDVHPAKGREYEAMVFKANFVNSYLDVKLDFIVLEEY